MFSIILGLVLLPPLPLGRPVESRFHVSIGLPSGELPGWPKGPKETRIDQDESNNISAPLDSPTALWITLALPGPSWRPWLPAGAL